MEGHLSRVRHSGNSAKNNTPSVVGSIWKQKRCAQCFWWKVMVRLFNCAVLSGYKKMLGPKFLFTKTTLLSTPKHFMKAAPSVRHYFMNCFSITQVQSATTRTGNKCRQCRRTELSADKHAGLQCYTLDTVSCLDTRIESTINNRASRL